MVGQVKCVDSVGEWEVCATQGRVSGLSWYLSEAAYLAARGYYIESSGFAHTESR